MAGPNSVTLCDDGIVQINDLGTNFYAKEEHVGKMTRARASQKELGDLNKYVPVKVHEGEVTEETL